MFYGLYINNLNLIITFGLVGVTCSIYTTSIGKENLLKEIFERLNRKNTP